MDEPRRKFSPPVVGGSSLLVIFAVLCLTGVALMSLSTARANERLSLAAKDRAVEYYEADRAAEEIYARLRAGELPEGVSVAGEEYRYTWTGENLALQVTLRRDEDGWSVLQWQVCARGGLDPSERSRGLARGRSSTMIDWRAYLEQAVRKGASDLFIVAGSAACMKLDGSIRHLDEQRLLPPDTEQIVVLRSMRRPDVPWRAFAWRGTTISPFSIAGLARFRVNTYRQRGSMATVIRIVP